MTSLIAPVASHRHPHVTDADLAAFDGQHLRNRPVQDHGDADSLFFAIEDGFTDHLPEYLEPLNDTLQREIVRNLVQVHDAVGWKGDGFALLHTGTGNGQKEEEEQ